MSDGPKNIITERNGVVPPRPELEAYIDALLDELRVEKSENALLRRQLKGCREGVTII